jgi:hypothetical protein
MQLDLKIDVAEDISLDDFNRKYFFPQRPLIIRGGIVKKQPCHSTWSLDWFKQQYPDLLVDVFDNRNQNHLKTAVLDADGKMKFSEFLDVICRDEPCSLRMFLFDIYRHDKKLYNYFSCPEIMKGVLGNVAFSFFGGKNTVVKMHYDVDYSNVLLTQFQGRKRVILFENKYSTLLYRLPFNQHNIIDILNPDYENYPGLKYVRGYDFILEPGDSLFMPSGYWHYNTYLEGGFAVAFRRLAPDLAGVMKGVINLGIRLPFDKTMNNLFGDKWYNWKIKTSKERALKLIHEMQRGLSTNTNQY